jgi:aryl-alcohol dehydrogenase-like predicted oxidoreductase
MTRKRSDEVQHERSGARLTRREVLALMAAAAGATGSGSTPSPGLLARPIPSGSETIPVIGVGTWRVFDVGTGASERAPLRDVLRSFVALGGRMIDSSPMYGAAETVAGDLASDLGVVDKLFVATKVWTSGREAGIAQMERSMKLLRKPTLDLMQIHNLLDWRTHLKTLREWKQAGRVRYIGVTHYTSSAYDELERVLAAEPLDFVQVNYSLAEREAEKRILPLARDRGVAVIVNRPFAEGDLFGRVRGRAVPEWSKDLGCDSWAQLFLKWILGHPAVTCVIPGTGKPQHLADNVKAGHTPIPDAALRDRIATAVGARR